MLFSQRTPPLLPPPVQYTFSSADLRAARKSVSGNQACANPEEEGKRKEEHECKFCRRFPFSSLPRSF